MSAGSLTLRSASLVLFAGWVLFSLLAATSILPASPGGSAAKSGWFLTAVAFSGAVGLALAWQKAPKAAWLGALLLLSGTSQLWLSSALWFKTFDIYNLGPTDKLAYSLIALQGIVSLAVLFLDPDKWLMRNLRALTLGQIVRLGLLFGALAVFSSSIQFYIGTYDRVGYVIQLLISSGAMAASVAGIAAFLFASDLADMELPRDLLGYVDRHIFILLPVLCLIIAAVFSMLAFGNTPVVEDETAYLFQAKTMAEGAFRAPELPASIADRFEFYLITNDPNGWYVTTVPGWPLVLALGVWIGLPWLVNPVLGAASVWLGMSFWQRVTNREQAIIVGLLMFASPWLLEVSASLMTHALVLALTLGAWRLTVAAKDRAAEHWRTVMLLLIAAGAMMGWIFLTRVVEGVLIGGLTGLWVLWYFGRQRRLLPVLAYGLGCFATGSLYFLYNLHMTGNLMTTPLMVYLENSWGAAGNAFGFGADIGPPSGWGLLDLWPGHSLPEAIINLNQSLNSLNTELHGWMMGSLTLLLIYLIWRRPRGANLAMLILAGAVILMHVFYWFSGTFYVGPRYWFGAFFAFIALSAGGYEALRDFLRSGDMLHLDKRLNTALLMLCGFSIIVFSSWRGAERYYVRTDNARVIETFMQSPDIAANAVIILPCEKLFYGAVFRNDPYLRADRPIYVRAREDGEIQDLQAAFPDRPIVEANELQSDCERLSRF